MVDFVSIQSAFSGLQQAGQIVKTILDLRDADLIREKARELTAVIIDAQTQTLSVQAQLSAAIEEVRELKERIMKMQKWDIEKARYELKEIASERYAYSLRETECGVEPPHSICTNCYQNGLKSILHLEHYSGGQSTALYCPRCNTEIITRGFRQYNRPQR